MFFYIYKYKMKILLREKVVVFWALIFPIILATLFNLSISNMFKNNTFEKIDIALVEENSCDRNFITVLEESELFNIIKVTSSEADKHLNDGDISGIIKLNKDINVIVKKTGANQSIIKEFADKYIQKSSTIKNIVSKDPTSIKNDFLISENSNKNYLKNIPINNSSDIIVVYFYTIVAMTCLMGSNYGCEDIVLTEGNQSSIGVRLNVSPVNKIKSLLSSSLASLTFTFTAVILLILYIQFVLKISFGDSIGLILLLCFVGAFTGISMGTMVSSVLPSKSENFKIGILIAISMASSCLAGMTSLSFKFWAEAHIPFITHINIATLITDGFYSLYYYDTYSQYFKCLGMLTLLGVIFSTITILMIRRKQYESI